MKYRLIQDQARASFFDLMSKVLDGAQMELEIASPDMGDQIEEEWASFKGLSYDPYVDVLYVHTSTIEHAISAPHFISVGDENGMIRSISMKDDGESVQIIKFREPLRLSSRR